MEDSNRIARVCSSHQVQARRKNLLHLFGEGIFPTPKGPRSRTVCNITGLPPGKRDLVCGPLKGKSFVGTEHVELESALDYSGLAVLADVCERFGISEATSPSTEA